MRIMRFVVAHADATRPTTFGVGYESESVHVKGQVTYSDKRK